jgi:hypothetical protein
MTRFGALLFAATLFLIGATAPPRVEIRNLEHAGAFEIQVNGSTVSLATQAHMEKRTDAGWVTVSTSLIILDECPAAAPPSCINVRADAPLRPVPWTGYSCSGQCNDECKKNVYLGPGTFRLTVFSCDHRETFHSPPFHLP